MTIKSRTTAAGPKGMILAGREKTIDDDMARAMVDAGFAVRVSKPEALPDPVTEVSREVETAAMEPDERAVFEDPPSRRRGRPPKVSE